MAIWKNLTVKVTAAGEGMTEYEDTSTSNDQADVVVSPNSITRYVEVTAGSNFELEISHKPEPAMKTKDLSCHVCIDGHHVDSQMLYKDQKAITVSGVRRCNGGIWTLQRLRFSDIVFDDTNIGPNLVKASDIQNIGTISIKFLRTVVNGRKIPKNYSGSTTSTGLESMKAISEKSAKGRAISHCTSFGPPQTIAARHYLDCQYLDSTAHPYAAFEFKYRSRRALQAEHIIPRSPSPLPLEDRPRESLTREELLELLGRQPLAAKPEMRLNLKPEFRTSLKREYDPEYDELAASAREPKKTRRQKNIDIVDLTDV